MDTTCKALFGKVGAAACPPPQAQKVLKETKLYAKKQSVDNRQC